MNVGSLDSWAVKAQALDILSATGEITRRQRRDLDDAIMNLDQMLRKRSGKIIRQKYMTDMEDDCGQVCQMGILAAIRSFDPSRGSFSTHVHNQIRAAVGDLKHKMKPESRNIQTILPVQHVSLSTPLGREGDDFTLGDTIEDRCAAATIDQSIEFGMAYLHIDRSYSHYLGRTEAREANKLSTPAGQREYRLNKLREREVFVRKFLQNETLEMIASDYGITRERARQIAAKIYVDPFDDDGKPKENFKPGMLNKYLSSCHVSDECLDGYHPVWDEYVALAWVEQGRDIRLSPTALDLSKIEDSAQGLEFHPADVIGILPEPAPDAVEVIVEDTSDDVAPRFIQGELPLFAVPNPPRKPSMMRRIATAATVIAAAGTMATAAAAQTSRAIPPEDYETGVSRIHKADSSRQRVRVVRDASSRTDIPVVDVSRVKLSTQAYGVMVASYADMGSLRSGWPSVRSGWNMLRGLRPGGMAMKAGKYALVFGPVNESQAHGICHEAKRKPRECVVTKFGSVVPQKTAGSAKQESSAGA